MAYLSSISPLCCRVAEKIRSQAVFPTKWALQSYTSFCAKRELKTLSKELEVDVTSCRNYVCKWLGLLRGWPFCDIKKSSRVQFGVCGMLRVFASKKCCL